MGIGYTTQNIRTSVLHKTLMLVLLYTQDMGKSKRQFQLKPLTDKQKAIVLPAMFIIGGIAVIIAVYTIIVMPSMKGDPRRGVAANGFTAYEEKNGDIGAGNVITKEAVAAALGDKAKSVGDQTVTNPFYYDGDRSQTATYNFVRADGSKASLFVDMTLFKNSKSMQNQHILAGTQLARIINGKSAYYMHAQTLGSIREYRLLVVNDLKAYKFVIEQPTSNITINEVSAVAALIKLAEKAQL